MKIDISMLIIKILFLLNGKWKVPHSHWLSTNKYNVFPLQVVGLSPSVNMFRQSPLWVDRISHIEVYLLYGKCFWRGVLSSGKQWERCEGKIHYTVFDRDLMKRYNFDYWDSCGVNLAFVFSFVSYLSCYVSHFIS